MLRRQDWSSTVNRQLAVPEKCSAIFSLVFPACPGPASYRPTSGPSSSGPWIAFHQSSPPSVPSAIWLASART